jgi:hypothetical protein
MIAPGAVPVAPAPPNAKLASATEHRVTTVKEFLA